MTGEYAAFRGRRFRIGIPQDEQDKIFAMYYQVRTVTAANRQREPGLAPAVSKRLAKNMGGDITVSSRAGKGSVFTLTVHAPAVAEEIEDALKMMTHAAARPECTAGGRH